MLKIECSLNIGSHYVQIVNEAGKAIFGAYKKKFTQLLAEKLEDDAPIASALYSADAISMDPMILSEDQFMEFRSLTRAYDIFDKIEFKEPKPVLH